MNNILKHNGYAARVEFDPEDCVFVGHIDGIEDGVGFHSDSAKGLVAAFHEAVEDYLETCKAQGKSPEKPFSGNVFLRVDPATHAKAATAARLSGKSLNQFGADALRTATERMLPA